MVKYLVEFDRTDEEGTNTYLKVEVPLDPEKLRRAENDDAMSQDAVMDAFEKRLRRSRPDTPVPSEIVWSDFRHPIEPVAKLS